MSDSYTNTNMRAESLNQAAAHDTGLYDPNVHDNQIVAMFENDEKAQVARDALVSNGIPESAIHVSNKGEGVTDVSNAEDNGGLWGVIKSLFMPDVEAHAYGEGLRRGHAVVVVQPTAEMDRHRIITVLESSNPVDFDAKLEEWRQAGYNYSSSSAAGAPTATGAAMDTSGMRSVDTTAAGTFRNAPSSTSSENDYMSGERADDMPGGANETAQEARSGAAGMEVSPAQAGAVTEERSRVGRREAIQGTGRVRSYVVERPMS
jgi:hypothetical protein